MSKETKKTVKILDNTYECNYPTVGQIIDIKILENQLSQGRINSLIMSGSVDDAMVAIDIKTIAHMQILFPDLIKDLKVNKLEDLRYDDFQAIIEEYTKVILPWLNDWKNSFNEAIEDKNKEEAK